VRRCVEGVGEQTEIGNVDLVVVVDVARLERRRQGGRTAGRVHRNHLLQPLRALYRHVVGFRGNIGEGKGPTGTERGCADEGGAAVGGAELKTHLLIGRVHAVVERDSPGQGSGDGGKGEGVDMTADKAVAAYLVVTVDTCRFLKRPAGISGQSLVQIHHRPIAVEEGVPDQVTEVEF